MVEQLRCPFCGSTSMSIEKDYESSLTSGCSYWVWCHDCGACGPTVDVSEADDQIEREKKKFKAMELWQKRYK